MPQKLVLRCYGCGCELQNTDPGTTGYTPRPLDEKSTIFCQRCFRLQHYGEMADESIAKPNYKEILDKTMKKKNLILYVVDLFNFEGSIIKEAHPFIKDNPVLVLANKRDILPKAVDDDKLKEFVYQRMLLEGIKPLDIVVISAYKNYNLDEIFDAVKTLRDHKDIYIIGASSVGKSSLINAMMRSYKNESRNIISTSPYPGTTVSTIRIPIDARTFAIDTPGELIQDSCLAKFEKTTLRYIIPRTEIRPVTFQLNAKQAVFFGGLAKFEIEEGPKAGYTFYCSNDVELHRCKLDKSNETFDSLVEKAKIQPLSKTITGSESLTDHEFVLPSGKRVDIVIEGLGWVSTKGNGQKIMVKAPRKINVLVRDAKI